MLVQTGSGYVVNIEKDEKNSITRTIFEYIAMFAPHNEGKHNDILTTISMGGYPKHLN